MSNIPLHADAKLASSRVMKPRNAREQAMLFIATYDHPEADAYARHLVRIARTWHSIQNANYSVQGIVNRLADELRSDRGEDYGCGWDDLRLAFFNWAIEHQWMKPDADQSCGKKT